MQGGLGLAHSWQPGLGNTLHMLFPPSQDNSKMLIHPDQETTAVGNGDSMRAFYDFNTVQEALQPHREWQWH